MAILFNTTSDWKKPFNLHLQQDRTVISLVIVKINICIKSKEKLSAIVASSIRTALSSFKLTCGTFWHQTDFIFSLIPLMIVNGQLPRLYFQKEKLESIKARSMTFKFYNLCPTVGS